MHPILFKLGPLNIYSYGVMVALGFALATLCIYARAPKYGIDRDQVVDLMIIMLISGLVGARSFYVLQNLDYYRVNPFEILNLSRGGLVWYGAFILGLAGAALYIRIKRMDFWQAADLAAPYIALAQSVGRIGCFLNGCCYGSEAPSGCLVAVKGACGDYLCHPTQLYSALALLCIYIILRLWQEYRRFTGEIFLGYCILYSYKRILAEFLRGDNPRIIFNLTMAQIISCAILICAAAFFITKASRWKKRS